MRMSKAKQWLYTEIKALLASCPLVLAAVVVLTLLWGTDLSAVPDTFQSSPVQPPGATATPTPTQQAPVVPTATVATGVATSTDAPTSEPGLPTSTGAPVPTDTVTPATGATAVPTVPASPTATATLPAATSTLLPPPTVAATQVQAPTESLRYPDSDSGLSFDFGMLFDSLALGVSYLWLCCGVLLLFAIPVIFAVLWVASQRRKQGPS
jgi:hypothetical protein